VAYYLFSVQCPSRKVSFKGLNYKIHWREDLRREG
jgi:hypothetical protein